MTGPLRLPPEFSFPKARCRTVPLEHDYRESCALTIFLIWENPRRSRDNGRSHLGPAGPPSLIINC